MSKKKLANFIVNECGIDIFAEGDRVFTVSFRLPVLKAICGGQAGNRKIYHVNPVNPV